MILSLAFLPAHSIDNWLIPVSLLLFRLTHLRFNLLRRLRRSNFCLEDLSVAPVRSRLILLGLLIKRIFSPILIFPFQFFCFYHSSIVSVPSIAPFHHTISLLFLFSSLQFSTILYLLRCHSPFPSIAPFHDTISVTLLFAACPYQLYSSIIFYPGSNNVCSPTSCLHQMPPAVEWSAPDM